jgi:hypothetical protein
MEWFLVMVILGVGVWFLVKRNKKAEGQGGANGADVAPDNPTKPRQKQK